MEGIRHWKGAWRALALCMAVAAPAAAQDYPARPISLVIGFAPGGGNDVMGRLVAEHLRQELGQPVVAENKAGADGAIAAQYVAKAAPDGYTLLSGSSGMMAYNPGLNPSLAYDPMKDFTPVTMIGYSQLLFSVTPKLPVHSLADLIKLAKAKPGTLFYASPSSPHQVAFEAFKRRAGVDIQQVPYKGSGPAILAAASGEVQVLVSSVSDALAQIRAGKLRPLAVTGKERSGFLKDVPTAIEQGVDFESSSWIGLYAPAGTPAPVADKLYQAISKVLTSDKFKERATAVGYEMTPLMSPSEFAAFQRDELTRWTKVIRDLNLQIAN
ncbi:tripartite tricarboxylate transporter substrate binding protein [Pigmentiphaga soli]|uniref:Tripartite tricarboxylate transporter substrate binding protein n=1 Tax=Pigmentiphaga soli TaxID=1007095 RepID=A0ABP8HK24_9BURK